MSQQGVAVQAATTVAEELAKPPPQSCTQFHHSSLVFAGAPTPPCAHTAPTALRQLNFLDRFLALWILLAMVLGLIVGNFSSADEVLEKVKFVDVSLPLAIALMVMMWPILCRVSPSSLVPLFKQRTLWKHLLFSVVLNWIVAPLFMFGLAWAFLPDKRELREGLILVGIARCIAMASQLLPSYGSSFGPRSPGATSNITTFWPAVCAINVVVNSLLQIVLYSPLAILYLRSVMPPWLAASPLSSAGFPLDLLKPGTDRSPSGIPLAAALVTRAVFVLVRARNFFQNKFLPMIAPLSLIALLFTIVIIFAAQGKQVVRSITDVLRIIPPLLVYFAGIFFATIFACRQAKVGYARSTSAALAGASNNFELAIAVAIASYGAHSPQALAATVGPLVECVLRPSTREDKVPVLLGLSYALLWYRRRSQWDLPNEDADEEKHLSTSESGSDSDGPSKAAARPEEAV
ncbi:SPOSA6832_00105 [Sporobolomyces salmonicolor]|uniref:SPOSA6832_00105-mRNA-1:cds n=1 Tax=Sporidiobolus salmonicolor TaxID=5005 RepID=A0A0D6EF97_SPOSA|nr:SPOSA6832_00105 [Sporobolomyces salmonicolor]